MPLGGRRGRRARDYRFTERTHSPSGIISLVLGIAVIIALALIIRAAWEMRGEAGIDIGAIGAFVISVDIFNMILSIMGWKSDETYNLFSKLGFFVNLVALILWALTIAVGMI